MSPVTPDQFGRTERPGADADPHRRGAADRAAAVALPAGGAAGPDRAGRRPPRQRPSSRGPAGARRQRAPLAVAAAVATCWAAVVSYLPVAVVMGLARFGGGSGTVGGAARVGLAGWLLGHGVPLPTDAGPLALPPLALGGFAAWRVARAGVHVSRAIGARRHGTVGQALAVGGAVGVAYGALGVLAAVLVGTGGPAVGPARAGLTLGVFGALAALAGALPTTGVLTRVAQRVPVVLRDGLRCGLVAVLLLLGLGAAAAGLAVATGGGEASDMISAYRTGVAGQTGITVVSLAYAPNAAIWAASYLLGPGFAIGVGTAVRTTEVSLGGLPAVPLLAGLPTGPVGGYGALLLALPVLAGAAAGWLVARRTLRPDTGRDRAPLGWGRLLGAGAIGGPVAAVLLGLAAAASGGSLGDGRLAQVGPVAWQVAAVAAVVLAVGAMIGAAATRAFTRS